MSTTLDSLADYELVTTGLHGHDTRTYMMMNRTLRKARTQVEELMEEPSNPVSVLIAEARVLILQMGKKEFAREAGMHPHAIQNAERPDSYPQHDSLARVYQYLEERELDGTCTQEEQRLLEETRTRFLELLVPEEDEHGRPLRNTMEGLYQKWRYQVGVEAFENATAKTNSMNRPIKDGTLWQRHESNVVPEFHEVRTIALMLDRDLDEAERIWTEQELKKLAERELPEPLALLVARLQTRIHGLRMCEESLRKDAGLKTDPTHEILRGEMPALDQIKDVLKTLFPKKSERDAFVKDWEETYEQIAQEPTFKSEFIRIRDENGWSNRMIASLLDIKAPEYRDDSYIAERTEAYRPSHEIRRMVESAELSKQAPARAAIALFANPEKEIDGVPEDEYLEQLFIDTAKRKYKRMGSALEHSTVRHYRMLCGIDMDDLVKESGYRKRDLQYIEQGKASLSEHETADLIELMKAMVQPKIDRAHAELERLQADPTNVAEGIELLAERMGGYAPLARTIHTDQHKSSFNVSKYRLQDMAEGTDVPSLVQLKHIVQRSGSNMTPELERDWYEQHTLALKNNENGEWENPLARAMGTIVFSKANNLKGFWETYMEGDVSYPTFTRSVQQLNVDGYNILWSSVSRNLNAVGLEIDDPQRLWMAELFKDFEELRVASYEADEEQLQQLTHNALRRWRKALKQSKVDPSDYEHMLGLTKTERGLKQ